MGAGRRIWPALLAVYTIWGSTYLAIRIALESFPPLLLTGVRFFVAGSVLIAFQRWRGTAWPSRRQWGNALLVGTLLMGVGTGGTTFAEQWVASGLAAVGLATVPLWVMLFGVVGGERPSRLELLALLIGFGGVVVLNLEGNLRLNPIGATALIIAAVGWSLGSIVSRHVALPPGLMGYAAEMMTGGVVLVAAGLMSGEAVPRSASPASALAWLYLVTFGSLVAFSAYMYLLQNARLSVATSYAYVNPLVALLLGVVVAGEPITGLGFTAAAIILGSVALLTLGARRRAS